MGSGTWLRQFHPPARADAPPLIVCPHAGTGAAAFRALSENFSAHYSVLLLQYPARQDRLGDPAATSIHELAAGALGEFLTSAHHTGAPLTAFGHSMGAIVAFEFVRAAEAAGVPVETLAISASVPPSGIGDLAFPRTDEEIMTRIVELEGTSADILANPALMKLAMPALRADYAAIDGYRCEPDVTVSARIAAFGADDDPLVDPADLEAWRSHTTGPLSVDLFDGGHFYLHEHVAALADVLTTTGSEQN
ncbi:MAG: alpha/beta fold hydrolase [Actinomycetota bacterium]